MPAWLKASHTDSSVTDKWEAGAALVGLHRDAFVAFLGVCKLAALLGMLLGGDVELVFVAALCLMYVCVSVGHYLIDGDVVGPALSACTAFYMLWVKISSNVTVPVKPLADSAIKSPMVTRKANKKPKSA